MTVPVFVKHIKLFSLDDCARVFVKHIKLFSLDDCAGVPVFVKHIKLFSVDDCVRICKIPELFSPDDCARIPAKVGERVNLSMIQTRSSGQQNMRK